MVALRQLRHHGSLHNGEPMNTITLTEVLEYYDGIQMFAARDTAGVHYVCDMIESAGDFDRYAVAAVCPKRLNDFRTGRVGPSHATPGIPRWKMVHRSGQRHHRPASGTITAVRTPRRFQPSP